MTELDYSGKRLIGITVSEYLTAKKWDMNQTALKLLSELIYLDQFTVEESKLIDKLPDWWLSQEKGMNVLFNNNTGATYIKFAKPKRMPFEMAVPDYNQDHDFTKVWLSLNREREKLVTKRREIRFDVEKYLDDFTDRAKLLKAWPELNVIMPDDFFFSPDTTPAQLPKKPPFNLSKELTDD